MIPEAYDEEYPPETFRGGCSIEYFTDLPPAEMPPWCRFVDPNSVLPDIRKQHEPEVDPNSVLSDRKKQQEPEVVPNSILSDRKEQEPEVVPNSILLDRKQQEPKVDDVVRVPTANTNQSHIIDHWYCILPVTEEVPVVTLPVTEEVPVVTLPVTEEVPVVTLPVTEEVPVVKKKPNKAKAKPRKRVSPKNIRRSSDILNPIIKEEIVDTETLYQPQGEKSAHAKVKTKQTSKCGRPRKIGKTGTISTIPELASIANSGYIDRKAKTAAKENIAKEELREEKVVSSRKNAAVHNQMEKARRNALKDSFTELKSEVPLNVFRQDCGNLKKLISKNCTLQGASIYIDSLGKKVESEPRKWKLKRRLLKLFRHWELQGKK